MLPRGDTTDSRAVAVSPLTLQPVSIRNAANTNQPFVLQKATAPVQVKHACLSVQVNSTYRHAGASLVSHLALYVGRRLLTTRSSFSARRHNLVDPRSEEPDRFCRMLNGWRQYTWKRRQGLFLSLLQRLRQSALDLNSLPPWDESILIKHDKRPKLKHFAFTNAV